MTLLIDGVTTELWFVHLCVTHNAQGIDRVSHYQYNTEGNETAHCFPVPLSKYPKNVTFRTNGHVYKIIK